MCRLALDALILGRQFLSTHGWTKYKEIWVENGEAYYCAVGALRYGAFFWPDKDGIGGFTLPKDEDVYKEALAALDRASRVEIGRGEVNIFYLNDLFAEDKETVLRAYDWAINDLREKMNARG